MGSTTRIPKAEITGVYGSLLKRFSRKMLGDVPEPAEVMWHHRAVLMDVMAPDVVLVSDGGGLVAAARRPIEGAAQVVAFLARSARAAGPAEIAERVVWLNGAPGARIDIDGEVDTAVSLVVEDGRITRIYAIRNPHKLTGLDEEAGLGR